MASINLAGVLRNPDTTLASGGEVRLIHRSNTGEVIAGFRETLNVNNDGTYDFNIQYGNVFIQTRDVGVNQWTDHGTLTINQDTTATTLPELLNAAVPPTDAQLLEFQILLSDAEAAADRAEAAGERSIKVYPTLADIQADSELEVGKVVTNFQAKLDYYVSETKEAGGAPITGTSPQLYANPQQTTPGTGETNTASNLGDGDPFFAQKVTTDLQFYSQKNEYGIESRLIDGTYRRGLNPFLYESIGTFAGNMSFLRSSIEMGINRSGIIDQVGVDAPFISVNGLGFFDSYTNLLTKNQDLSDSSWQKTDVTVGASLVEDPELSNGFYEVTNSANSAGYIRKVATISQSTNKPSASCFFKDNGSGFCSIRLSIAGGSGSFGTVTYDFGTESLSSDGDVTGYIEKLHSGIVRLFCFALNNSTNNIADVRFYASDASGANPSSAGDSVLMWLPCFTDEESFYYPPTKTDTTQITVPASSASVLGNGNLPNRDEDFMLIFSTSIPDDGVNRTVIRNGNSSKGIYFRRRNNSSIECRLGDGVSFSNLTAAGINEDIYRFVIVCRGGEFKLFIDGLVASQLSNVKHQTDYNDIIRFGEQLNSYLKVEKWIIGSTYTDQKILELGGPENAIS